MAEKPPDEYENIGAAMDRVLGAKLMARIREGAASALRALDAPMEGVIGELKREISIYARWRKAFISYAQRLRQRKSASSKRARTMDKLGAAYNKLRGQTGREHPKLEDIAAEAGVPLSTAQDIGIKRITPHADKMIAE